MRWPASVKRCILQTTRQKISMQIIPNKRKEMIMIQNNKDKRTDQHRWLHHMIYIPSKDVGIHPRQNSNLLLNPNLQFKHSILESSLAILNFKRSIGQFKASIRQFKPSIRQFKHLIW